MRYGDGGLLPPMPRGGTSLPRYDRSAARKKSQEFVRIFGWCYTIAMILSFLMGWAIGGIIR
jgi:hypothetical protein